MNVVRVTGLAGAERQLIGLLAAQRLWEGIENELMLLLGGDVELAELAQLEEAGCRLTVAPMKPHLSRPVTRLIRERFASADVVHTHLVHADWHALAASRGRRAGWVSTKHNHDRFRERFAFRAVERRVDTRADATVAISESLAEFTHRMTGVRPQVIRYGYPAPAEPPRLSGGDAGHRLLAVGRLVPQKGIDTVLEAFARIRATFPEARLTIAGDGPLRGELEALAARLAITGAVDFRGWIERPETLMPEHDLLLHPARWEGFGLVLLEAAAAGLPVVASDVGAIPEVVGDAAVLVSPDDADALAAEAARLLADRAAREALAERNAARLEHEFSLERNARELRRVYESVMRGRGGYGGR